LDIFLAVIAILSAVVGALVILGFLFGRKR
jgi:hypothetical protein